MGLTPEERRKIYEEEKARLEAQQQLKEEKAREKSKIGLVCLGVGVFVAFILLLILYITLPPNETSNSKITGTGGSVGSESKLYVEGLESITLAVDKKAYDELTNCYIAKDKIGILNLVIARKSFTVENGTRVLVIAKSFTMSKVRVRILEGKNMGKAGWVSYEWVW